MAEVGQTLADVTLPTYENGTLAWNDPTASVGEIGEHKFTATFTPFDTKNYKSAEATITVIVKEKVAFAVYSETDNSLTFYKKLENKIPAEGATDSKGRIVTKVYKDFEEVIKYGETGAPWCEYGSVITSVEIADDGIAPKSMNRWFQNFTALTSIDVSGFDTRSVCDMSIVFSNCNKLSSIEGLEKWDVRNVESMHSLFSSCSALTSVDGIASWDTSSLKYMDWMFANCASLTNINLSAWNVSNLTLAQVTFSGCTNLQTVNISGWSTGSLASTQAMFENCTNLTSIEGIATLNTSNVTDMRRMFNRCSRLIADCSGWTVKSGVSHSSFKTGADGVTEPNWNATVEESNNSQSTPATASVVAGDKTSAVSTVSDNTSAVAQNADGNGTINSEETATTEASSAEGTSEVAGEVSSTAESDAILQEVNCLSALSKENSSEAEMKAVA